MYDYVDECVPMLQRMSEKRIPGYRNLGYTVESHTTAASTVNGGQERRSPTLRLNGGNP